MIGIYATGNRKGFTLVEIAITVAILGILVMLAISSFAELREKYAVEAETKNFYAAMMEARGRAMQRNRFHFVNITPNGYAVFEDTNTAPDGDGIFQSVTDNQIFNVAVKHTIDVSHLSSTGITDINIFFDRRGIVTGIGHVRFLVTTGSSANPDYDCISIKETRLRTGKYSSEGGGSCVEK